MKAIVVLQYGDPDVMKYTDSPDPSPGPGEVLVRVSATSVNPFDLKQRSGEAKAFAPVVFPGILGIDLSGTVVSCGAGVKGLAPGDRVFGMANRTYAELCAVKAESLAKIPAGLDPVEAAALPVVTTTGHQLITEGASVRRGQSVLVTGALGSVGRSAVFVAKSLGATVVAGVRAKQVQPAAALKADAVVAVDDKDAVASLQMLDAVADTVNGATAESLIGKVKPGGTFASVLGPPRNSADHSSIKIVPVVARSNAKMLLEMARAVVEGKLAIPIAEKMPLKDAAKAHALVQRGVGGKVLLVAQ